MSHSTGKKRSSLLLSKVFPPASSPLHPRNERPVDAVLVLNARLPPVFWRRGWLLRQIKDTLWREFTAETQTFPRTLTSRRKGHPAYVLEEIGNYALRICPCTSRPQAGPFIPEGTVLQPTGFVCDRRSTLVMASAPVIARNGALFDQYPQFLGILPPEQLQR